MAERGRVKEDILYYLQKHNKATKKDIAISLDVSTPTITHYINEMEQKGIIINTKAANSTGGRKPKIIEFLPNEKYAFGIELTSTCVRMVMINLSYKVIWKNTFLLNEIYETDQIMMMIGLEMNSAINLNNIELSQVLGMGFCVESAKDINKIENYNKMFSFPIMCIKLGYAGVLSQKKFIRESKVKKLLFLWLDENMDVGIFQDDKILYSGFNEEPLLGVSFNIQNDKCIRVNWREELKIISLKKLFSKSLEKQDIFFEEIMEKCKEKNNLFLDIYREYLIKLIFWLINAMYAYNVDKIVIAGEIPDWEDVFLENLEKVGNKIAEFNVLKNKIMVPKIGLDTCAIGAGILPVKIWLNN